MIDSYFCLLYFLVMSPYFKILNKPHWFKPFKLIAKVWGPDDGVPVLALHGWQDNAGSFDTIAPLLPSHIRLVCLDLCGNSKYVQCDLKEQLESCIVQAQYIHNFYRSWLFFTLPTLSLIHI